MIKATHPRSPRPVWIAGLTLWLGSGLNLCAAITSGIATYSTAEHQLGQAPFLVIVGVVALFVLAPAAAGAFALQGHRASRPAVFTIGVAAALTSLGYVLAWVSAALFLVAAVLLLLPSSSHYFRNRGGQQAGVGMPGERVPTLGSAYVWLGFFGVAGAHLFYVRRAWQGVVYLGMLCLALLSVPSPIGVVLIVALIALVCIDVSRLRSWI